MSFLWYRPGLCVCNCKNKIQNTILRQTWNNEKEILAQIIMNKIPIKGSYLFN